MKIGIYGGTFDPVHLGHLILAETCLDACDLDQICWIPAFCSPLKQQDTQTPAKQRLAMVELATAGISEFVVDAWEVKQKRVSYTFETLESFQERHPDDELYFLMGADSLRDLPKWKEPEHIAELATIIAVNRGNQSSEEFQRLLDQLPAGIQKRVNSVDMPGIDLSASQIRDRVQQQRSIRFLTPRAVERYIIENQLYATT